jgi:hypothetical protein
MDMAVDQARQQREATAIDFGYSTRERDLSIRSDGGNCGSTNDDRGPFDGSSGPIDDAH